MEIRHRILEFSGQKKYDILKAELDKIGTHYEIKLLGSIGGIEKKSIEYWTTENDTLYPYIAKLIKKHKFYVQSGLYYSEDDINSAEWLWATAGEFQYPQPEDTYKEVTYDLSGYCQFCGIGKVQNNPFRLKTDFEQNGLHFLGLHWVFDEIFVRSEAKDILENNHLDGIEFIHPILGKNLKPLDSVYQMKINTVVNPGLLTGDLETVTCKEHNEEVVSLKKAGITIHKYLGQDKRCGRVKYHYPLTKMITFKRSTFCSSPDIVKSSEYFGSGAGANRLILVSQKFVGVVKRNNLCGLNFTPIKLVE